MNAQEIKQARTAMGMSRQEFAQELGVCVRTVYFWEEGQFSPNVERERKIREVMLSHRVEIAEENGAIPFPIRRKQEKHGKESHVEKYRDVPPMALLVSGKNRIAIHDYSVSMGRVEKVLSAIMTGLSEKSGYCWNNVQEDKYGRYIKKVCGKIYLDSMVYCEPELARQFRQDEKGGVTA